MSVANIRRLPLLMTPRVIISFVVLLAAVLTGCASSNVARDATSNIDNGVQNGRNMADNMANSNMADTVQNSSQTSKGVVLGAAAGGLTGMMSSGIGILPGLATGAVLGGSYGAYIDANTSLRDKLENRGATIVILGDQILIALPSDRLFDPDTSDIKLQAYSTLSMVSQFINNYTKILVKVSAYTNSTSPKEVSLALSKAQADNVAKMLMAYGVNARILYSEGYGGTNLVEKNEGDADGNDNYRIEITLQKEYV